MMSLIIYYKDQVDQVMKMLVEEVCKATNIKSRVTRENVTDALTCTIEKLKTLVDSWQWFSNLLWFSSIRRWR
jgi:peptide subunit release factor 1 (eRF1)